MKCVLVLITVHLCYTIGIHANLYSEMMHSLRALHNLSSRVTFINSVLAPEAKMRTNASCLGVFKRELMNVLDNVEDPKGNVYVRKLRENLKAWGSHEVNDTICPFKHQRTAKKTFEKYIAFLQKLNSSG